MIYDINYFKGQYSLLLQYEILNEDQSDLFWAWTELDVVLAVIWVVYVGGGHG